MRLFLALFLLLPTPLWANCANAFRAGMIAYANADTMLTQAEATLYGGMGWVTRGRVIDRLENLSDRTTACQEVARISGDLVQANRFLDTATAQFRLAESLCWGDNRDRARDNGDRLGDSTRAIAEMRAFIASLAPNCGGG